MSLSSNGPPSFGSLNTKPFLPLPPLPAIVAEWAALLPLIFHLASYQSDHQLIGQVALLGRISVGIFPRLGVLAGVSKLLGNGEEFSETASTKGSSSQKVWDVKWGSVFPAANGAASTWLMQSALRHAQVEAEIGMEMLVVRKVVSENPPSTGSIKERTTVMEAVKPALERKTFFARCQTLHMVYFSRSNCKTTRRAKLSRCMRSRLFHATTFISQLGIVIGLALLGAYGSAVVLTCGAVTQVVCNLVEVVPSPGFLQNNEMHDACMLVATHENASIWYLYVGDRGIVDSLLNKSMVTVPTNKKAAAWFKVAHVIQLLATTFVAAQKGWDAVCLLVLTMFVTALSWRLDGARLASQFCETNGIDIKAKTFRFSGRSPMLGAIQCLSGSHATIWMDNIIVPCPRRNVWLQEIMSNGAEGEDDDVKEGISGLSDFDQGWVLKNKQLVSEAAEVLKQGLVDLKQSSAEL